MIDTESRTGKRLRTLTAAAAVGGLVLAGGVAYAAIPASDGTITGCYTTANVGSPKGSLRVVDDAGQCRKNEQPLTWNQTGPTGAPGPAGENGAQGPRGETGPAGPARAPDATVVDATGLVVLPPHFQKHRVATMSLPEGKWALTVKSVANAESGARLGIDCDLIEVQGNNLLDATNVHINDLSGASVPMSLASIATVPPSSGTVDLLCSTEKTGVRVRDTMIVAIAVS